jgi:DNA-binding transcriptional ArsR family regulator
MSVTASLDRVFQALSDGTRRRIVERLQTSPETTGEIAGAFPKISRIAVMKHLDVLESAGLIKVKRQGKFRWNELNRIPLDAADEWLARHIERRRDMGMRIKQIAEEEGN